MYSVISSRSSINILILIFSLSEFSKHTNILGVCDFFLKSFHKIPCKLVDVNRPIFRDFHQV